MPQPRRLVTVPWRFDAIVDSSFSLISSLLKVCNYRRWRWTACEQPQWDGRNQAIAALIPPGSAVLDVGAGAQTLRAMLAPGSHYQPCDVVPSTPDLLLCNFNEGHYPALTRHYDVVVGSGVAEYMIDLDDFIPRLAGYGDRVILSYAVRQEGGSKLGRMRVGWFNHLSQAELEDLFDRHGLRWERVKAWEDQLIYRYHREP